MKTQLMYDGSFEGFLTSVFEVFEKKIDEALISRPAFNQPQIGFQQLLIITDEIKSDRVWTGLKKRLSISKLNELFKAYLSESAEIENLLLSYIRLILRTSQKVEFDYGNSIVLAVTKTAKKVHREKHRMEAFVRFHLGTDGVYTAVIEPDFNVLPLIVSHFKERYADQDWLIFDRRRGYGIRYDLKSGMIQQIFPGTASGDVTKTLSPVLCQEEEPFYQNLWKTYFTSVNIKERKNDKLHIRHVPFRYWKYLVEKN